MDDGVPRSECALAMGNLVSDAGLAADAAWYPEARICSSCMLLGKNLDVNKRSGGVTAIVSPTSDRPAADHCIREKFQHYR